MGCRCSKVDDLPVVVLCRERRDLIRAAADCRFEMASRHQSYFRALESVGEALHRFVQEELTVVPTPSSSSGVPSSPVLTIPSSEGKVSKSKSVSVSVSGRENPGASGLSTSPSSLTHSPSLEGSHLHSPSPEAEENPSGEGGGTGGEPYPYASPWVPSPYYSYGYYMKHSSATPNVVYQNPSSGYGYTQPYGMPDDYFGAPMGSAPEGGASSYYNYGNPMSAQEPPAASPQPPPPPPAPEVSAWDFLNPFETYEGPYAYYRYGSVPSSPNSTEVREQEGIPDLEEETEPEPMKESTREKKRVAENQRKERGPSSSKSAQVHETNSTVVEGIGSKSSTEGGYRRTSEESSSLGDSGNVGTSGTFGKSKSMTSETADKVSSFMEEDTKKKEVTFELDATLPTEKSGSSLDAALFGEGTRDVTEVTKEIKEQFKIAASSGMEISSMLEVGKLRYRSSNAAFREISSRVLDFFPMLAHSRHSFKGSHNSTAHSLKFLKTRYGDPRNSMAMKSGSLSSTLEKLCVWERKLYKEVKDEERLRVTYERQCKRLKNLDERGAESQKIDATRASIRKLLTKLEISIKSVDAISSRIHRLRDEKLQPQLIELVHGLIRMWKSMLDCHQKQFLAIAGTKSRNLVAKPGIQGGLVAKLTRELEFELLNWLSTFNEWISMQRAYFGTLNEWLHKCLYLEPEETPDGVAPYSPGKLGAPATFIICNDWCEAMEKISEDEVIMAVQNFAAQVHNLWENQDEEERQKLRAEYLSKDLAGKLRSLQEATGLPVTVLQNGSTQEGISLTENKNANASLHGRMASLESMRKRLEEETAKHKEVLKHINVAARTGIRSGLVPIFQSLGTFSLENLKAYERVRIPKSAGS